MLLFLIYVLCCLLSLDIRETISLFWTLSFYILVLVKWPRLFPSWGGPIILHCVILLLKVIWHFLFILFCMFTLFNYLCFCFWFLFPVIPCYMLHILPNAPSQFRLFTCNKKKLRQDLVIYLVHCIFVPVVHVPLYISFLTNCIILTTIISLSIAKLNAPCPLAFDCFISLLPLRWGLALLCIFFITFWKLFVFELFVVWVFIFLSASCIDTHVVVIYIQGVPF